MASVAAAAAMMVVASSGACTTEAYTFGPSHSPRFSPTDKAGYSPASIKKAGQRGIRRRREDGSAVTLYLFPSRPSAVAGNLRRPRSGSESETVTGLPAMSDSILAEGDAPPSFSMAHGILSPAVVTRIADSNDLEEGGALHRFLKTYKRKGPMACLPMLSDPCILPELTKAMREIA